MIHLVLTCCGVLVIIPAQKAGDAGSIPIGTPNKVLNLQISWQEPVTHLTWGKGKYAL